MTFVTTGVESDATTANVSSTIRSIKVHSLVIAASSDFLKTWMETTFVADLQVSLRTWKYQNESKTHIGKIFLFDIRRSYKLFISHFSTRLFFLTQTTRISKASLTSFME
jgi:hypothetical protein